MKEFLETIARGLVEHPEAVRVQEVPAKNGSVLQLRVSPEDRGKLIGRQGRTARALRILLRACALRSGKRLSFEIVTDRND